VSVAGEKRQKRLFTTHALRSEIGTDGIKAFHGSLPRDTATRPETRRRVAYDAIKL